MWKPEPIAASYVCCRVASELLLGFRTTGIIADHGAVDDLVSVGRTRGKNGAHGHLVTQRMVAQLQVQRVAQAAR